MRKAEILLPARRRNAGTVWRGPLGIMAAMLAAWIVWVFLLLGPPTDPSGFWAGIERLPRTFAASGKILPFGVVGMVIAGVPCLVVLELLRLRSMRAYCVAGVVGGTALAWAVSLFMGTAAFFGGHEAFFGGRDLERGALWLGAGAASGLAGAFCFWIVARPDRTSEREP